MEKLRVGLIGCGGITYAHAPRLAKVDEAQVVAFCDTDPQASAKWRSRILGDDSEAPLYDDYRQMVEAEALDAVLILTPHNVHYEQSLHCLKHGVHVLLEKPMCLEVAECQEVIDAAASRGLSLVIGYHRHYDPEYVRAKAFIDGGGIGKVQLIAGVLTQDWQRGCQGKWRVKAAISGGGQLNDSGSHLQDAALWLAGSRVAEVMATIENNGEEVDIFSTISGRLRNGALLSLVVSGGACAWGEQLSLWGTEGAMHYQVGKFRFVDTKGNELDAGPLPQTTDPVRNLVDAILGRAPVVATGIDGLAVQELTRAAYRSAALGTRVLL